MASSGWQTEQQLYKYNSNVNIIGNIRVDSITHSGTNLRITGAVAVGARGTSGYYAYYNYGVQEKIGGAGWVKIVGNSAQMKVGGSDYHQSFDVTFTNVPAASTSYSVPVQFKACYNSDCSSTYWSVTKNWTVQFGSSGDAPSGAYITYNSSTWDSITFTDGFASGTLPMTNNHVAVITGSTNGDAKNITTLTGGRLIYKHDNSSDTVYQFVAKTSTADSTMDSPIDIKGLLCYRIGYYLANSFGNTSGVEGTVRYTAPAPSSLSYSALEDNTYRVRFVGSTTNNHTTYDTAELKRTVRYKIGTGDWVVVDNAAVKAVGDTTQFDIVIPPATQATVEGYMTYHGMQSTTQKITISNSSLPVSFYASANSKTKKVVKFYASVDGKSKRIVKIYGSKDGVARKVYEDV